MKNRYYNLMFLSLFINTNIDNKNMTKVPSYISDSYNKKFLKGIV